MKRTRVTTTRTALIAALAVLLCTAVGLAILLPTAQAHNSSSYPSGTVQIGEIFNSSAGTFDEANLQQLINLLYNGSMGGAPTSVNELSAKVGANTTTFGKADDAAANKYAKTLEVTNKQIIVKFGGIDWIPVFLSLPSNTNTATNGNTPKANDVILTLWQAQGNSYSTWANTGSGGWSNNDADGQTYPSNMYGTSYIRAVTLNNGGQYATSKSALSANQAQNPSNAYARFTMKEINGVHNAAYDSIVSPRYINWQENQTAHNVLVNGTSNWLPNGGYLNNESWSGSIKKEDYYNQNYYYVGKTNYTAWADDLLWLPSDSEVGFTGTNSQASPSNGTNYVGLWKTTGASEGANGWNSQRSNAKVGSGSPTSNVYDDCSWLRTAYYYNYSYAGSLTSDGSFSNVSTDQSLMVRPALHLNLTTAMGEVEPTDTEQNKVFNGQQQSFDLGITSSWANGANNRVNIQITQNDGDGLVDYTDDTAKLTATKAGTYKVTVTPATGWHWRSSNNAEPLTFTLTINPAPLTFTPTSTSGKYNGQVHDTDVTFSGLFDTLSRNTDYTVKFDGTPKNANSYTVTVMLTDTPTAKNYSLSDNTFTYTINKAPLTITANSTSITYGDNAKNDGVTYGEFVNGEDEHVINGTLSFDYGGYAKGKGVGEYVLSLVENLSADNYEIVYKSGTLTVNPKPITVTIANGTHEYGGAVAPYGISDPEGGGGWVNEGDKETLFGLITFLLKKQTSPYDSVELNSLLPVGKYDITAQNKDYGNYNVTFNNGEYEVTPAKLTITAISTIIYYGDEAPNAGVEYSGFVNNEDSTVLGGKLEYDYHGYKVGSGVDTYVISVSGLTSDNYEITFENGTLTVNPRAITIQIDNIGHVYGDTPATFEISDVLVAGNWVGSDNKTTLGTLTFLLDDGNATWNDLLPVGKYDITVESRVYGNYNVTFVKGVYTVTAAKITVNDESAFASEFSYNYDASGILRHAIEVEKGVFTVKGEMALKIAYSNIRRNGSVLSSDFTQAGVGGVYTVWKVGTYTVTVTVTADNHEALTKEITVTITPTQLTVRLTGNTIQKFYGEAIGNVNNLVFENLTVGAVGFGGTDEALREVLRFALNGQTNVTGRLNSGTYSFTVTSSTEGFTIAGSLGLDGMVQIDKATPKVATILNPNTTTVNTSGKLPELGSVAEWNNSVVAGSIKWDSTVLVPGTGVKYSWTWTPNDTENYEIVTGVIEFDIVNVEITGFTATFDPGDNKIYITNALNDLKEYLAVHIMFSDGVERDLDKGEYRLEGELTVGGVRITVVYLADPSQTTTFDVEVLAEPQQTPGPGTDDPGNDNSGNTPGDDTPGNDTPGNDTPGNDNSGNNDPGKDNSDTPSEPKQPFYEKIHEWFESTPLPLGYAAAVLGAELLLVIILAIAARKPKKQ